MMREEGGGPTNTNMPNIGFHSFCISQTFVLLQNFIQFQLWKLIQSLNWTYLKNPFEMMRSHELIKTQVSYQYLINWMDPNLSFWLFVLWNSGDFEQSMTTAEVWSCNRENNFFILQCKMRALFVCFIKGLA